MLFGENKVGTGQTRKITEKQFDAEVEAMIATVKREVSPFINDTAEKQETRVREARINQDFFNQTYLPHYFLTEGAPCHREWEELCEMGERLDRPVAIGAPRDHAKSTRLTFARPLKKLLFD